MTLTVIEPSGTRRFVEVARSPFRIGRLPECELSLRESRVSRNHAQILLEDGKYFIEDLGSRHGVFVNGQKVDRVELRAWDRIDFGIKDSYQVIVGRQEDTYSAPLMKKVVGLQGVEGTGSLGRLRAVIEVARTLESAGSVDEVLVAAVDAALTVTGAERGFLMLKGERGELEVKVARDRKGQPLEPEDMRVPRKVIQEALYRRRDLFSMSIDPEQGEIDAEKAGQTMVAMELRSVVCVPVVRIRLGLEHETSRLSPGEDTLGVLYMDSREPGKDLAAGSQEILQSLAIEISSVLENARLLAEQRQKHRLDNELEIARQIQQSMLPAELPSEGWFVAAGSSEACFQVGGDYFDVMQLSPEVWAAVLVDVSGKGVSAALLTSLIQGAFFSTSSADGSLSDNVARINRYISERSRGAKFATVFYCVVRRDGLLRWVNAGHCPAFLSRASGEIETLGPSSHPIGIFPETTFPEDQTQLSAGDKLVVYTDGVSEAANWAHEQFGEDRLRVAVSRNGTMDTPKLFEALHEEVNAFTAGAAQKDDVTLLVLGYQG